MLLNEYHLEYRNSNNGDLKSETHNETELHICTGSRVSVSVIIGIVIRDQLQHLSKQLFPTEAPLSKTQALLHGPISSTSQTKIVQYYNIITFCLICETGDLISDR